MLRSNVGDTLSRNDHACENITFTWRLYTYLDPPRVCCILPMPDIVALTLRVNKSLCIRETDKGGEMRVRWSKSCWMKNFQGVSGWGRYQMFFERLCGSFWQFLDLTLLETVLAIRFQTRHFWNDHVPFLKMGYMLVHWILPMGILTAAAETRRFTPPALNCLSPDFFSCVSRMEASHFASAV